jgi:hypothetical protein
MWVSRQSDDGTVTTVRIAIGFWLITASALCVVGLVVLLRGLQFLDQPQIHGAVRITSCLIVGPVLMLLGANVALALLRHGWRALRAVLSDG